MRAPTIRIALAALATVVFLFPITFGQEKPKAEHYSGAWMVTGGAVGGSTVSINIHINRYNTDEDIKKFADILSEGGTDRLRRALEKEDVGQLSPTGRVGIPIAIARKLTDGNKTIIRIATARNLSFLELRYAGRSTDYPFTIMQLELDENGKGSGTAIASARIQFNKKEGTYEIESLQHGTAYNKIVNVQLMK